MKSRVVWITGSSRGIGAAMARKFAANGDVVIISYCHSEKDALLLQEEIRKQGGQAYVVKVDVSNHEEVSRAFCTIERMAGSVDVLIHNAGISQQKMFQDLTDEDWRQMMGVHLDGAFYTIREVLPSMISQKYGQILLISSMWGVSGGSCEVHYSAAKAALIGLTKALAKEVGLSGVRVNCLAPGVIQTDMNRMHSPETMAQLAEETPLGHLGVPMDVAEAAWFLTSDQAGFITGQTLSVDGGIVL